MSFLVGCAGGQADTRTGGQSGDKIDSLLPMTVLLERFRGTEPAPVRLAGGSASRTGLARRFLSALERRDSAALVEMVVTKKEFGWLVFPEHLYARPPYELDPDIFWLQLQVRSSAGVRQALTRLGGRPLRFIGLDCGLDTLQGKSAEVLFWSPCRVRYLDNDSLRAHRLFGTIVEHKGIMKFLSYTNEF